MALHDAQRSDARRAFARGLRQRSPFVLLTEPSPYQSDYERAMELATAAEPAERQIKDRIGDYEKALELLEVIAADAPAAEQPAGLTEQIENVKRQLERLKLERFFP